MIRFEGVTFTYDEAPTPTLRDVDLEIPAGELCLVVGRTGSGKSTLLRAMNGLVPHFTGGTLRGQVSIADRDTRTNPPRELADLVGFVVQDPVAGFVTDTVEDELAYSAESLAIPPDVMRRRVEEVLDLLGLVDMRRRPLESLSGGQQQRVAIGAALTSDPKALILDEPTSALDPGAAEEVLAVLHRLVHDVGITVVVAEHRLERVVQFADRVITVADGTVTAADPAHALEGSSIAPPVVRLGRAAKWSPPPVTIRQARLRSSELLARLPHEPPSAVTSREGSPALSATGVTVRYPDKVAVSDVDLELLPGERVALMGRNGSGKSTLMWALQGTGPRHAGSITIKGDDPAALKPVARRQRAGLVPQTASDLLYLETVAAELAQADRETESPAGTAEDLLHLLAPDIPADQHPRDLSEGQRLALVLAVTLSASPAVLLLDEPTRGLDLPAKQALTAMLERLAADGRSIVLATHDVEFVAAYATRVVVLADGEVVTDGPTNEVLTASPLFSPQITKILGSNWLTPEQVAAALAPDRP